MQAMIKQKFTIVEIKFIKASSSKQILFPKNFIIYLLPPNDLIKILFT
jgi:hypothetical protein